MSGWKILWLLTITMMLTSCGGGYHEYEYRGVLYTDSTLTTPISNATLTFGETDGIYYNADRQLLGSAVTDRDGRWAFQYIHNLQNPYQNTTKFQRTEYFLMITYGNDTVYWDILGNALGDTLKLYPGRPLRWQTDGKQETYGEKGGAK